MITPRPVGFAASENSEGKQSKVGGNAPASTRIGLGFDVCRLTERAQQTSHMPSQPKSAQTFQIYRSIDPLALDLDLFRSQTVI